MNSMAVFTDLDGTLLDHDTYSAVAAMPMLQQLKLRRIPVIPNTSKTFDELLPIRRALELDTPFIVENGAAIYIPDSFLYELCEAKEDLIESYTSDNQLIKVILGSSCKKGCYYRKSFIEPRDYWLSLLAKNTSEFAHLYTGFSRMSITDIQALTGLSLEQAQAASKREYGEPLQWHGSDQELAQFKHVLQKAGATVVKGGRFVHVGGNSDKGRAMLWLAAFLQSSSSVALGDGENDSAMLEAADIAVQVRSNTHDFPRLERSIGVIKTSEVGPKGWSEAIGKIFFSEFK